MHMVIFLILSFYLHLIGWHSSIRKKKIPSSILALEYHSGLTDFKNIFNALTITVIILFHTPANSHLGSGVPSNWSVNFGLDPICSGVLPCFLARCSRFTFVLLYFPGLRPKINLFFFFLFFLRTAVSFVGNGIYLFIFQGRMIFR